jgi:predicted DNA-binding transcriptional regulator YafY
VNRTDRLYALVEELRAVAPRPRSAPWLARRFEVSVRTIERDLDALRQSGVPVFTEPGRSGGYAIDRSRTLPPLALTAAEALAISVALRESTGSPFAEAAASAAGKVLATLPADVQAREQLLAGTLYEVDDGPGGSRPGGGGGGAGGPGGGPGTSPAIDRTVMTALDRQRVLGLTYVDRAGRRTERDVEPLGLLRSSHGWYLIAWCRLRHGVRGFRLPSIEAAELRGEHVPARDPAILRREMDRFDARAFGAM